MIIYYISEYGPNYITKIYLSVDKYICDIIIQYAFECDQCYGYFSQDIDSDFLIACICCNSIYCIKCKNKIPMRNRIWNSIT